MVEIRRILPPGVPDEPVIHVVTTEKVVTICPVYPSVTVRLAASPDTGGPPSGPKATITVKTFDGESVIHVAPH